VLRAEMLSRKTLKTREKKNLLHLHVPGEFGRALY
jgi:hypothetical protein